MKTPLRLSPPPIKVSTDTQLVATRLSPYASLSSLYVSPARNIQILRVQKDLRGCQSGFGILVFSFDQTNVASERNNTLWLSGVPDCCGVSEGHGREEYAVRHG